MDTHPRLAGLLGWPVSHSLSPLIHHHWFNHYNVDGSYVRLPVQTEDLPAALKTLPRVGFHGLNVTIPHKQTVFRLVEDTDSAARRMQAVNTVLFKPDGTSRGINTDGYGFTRALEEGAPDWNRKAGPVVLLGTGGATRAIAAILIDQGITSIRLTNRTQARAEELALFLNSWSDAKIEVFDWTQRSAILGGASLLVNCTSLGMKGQPELDIDLNDLAGSSPVFDIVYNPLETALLKRARLQGNPAIDGLGMLLHQAAPGFEHWGGYQPSIDADLRQTVLAGLEQRS